MKKMVCILNCPGHPQTRQRMHIPYHGDREKYPCEVSQFTGTTYYPSFMASVQRLLQTTSRVALRSFGSPSALAYRHIPIVRYNSTATNAKPAPVNSTSKSSENGPNSVAPLPDIKGRDGTTDWSRSYSGLSVQPFSKEVADILQAPIDPLNVEMKPGEYWFLRIIFMLHSLFQRWSFVFA